MNPRVKKILKAEPFIITAMWSDDKVRTTDFGKFLAEYLKKKESIFFKILQPAIFPMAKTDGRTIYWENIAEMLDYDGKVISAPLDFDPDVLFSLSESVEPLN